jgi:hypothetical protein
MFFYLDIDGLNGTQRHILQPLADGGVMSFPLTDDNPNKPSYDAWVADGNVAEEWSPNASD